MLQFRMVPFAVSPAFPTKEPIVSPVPQTAPEHQQSETTEAAVVRVPAKPP